ncbi:oxidoreductase [Aureococcus anophagefferens]|nr:oxidoreductase [Aureococcus anophagefferens]
MGIMLAGGMGEELAHWVATGAATRDLFGADARRFHGDCSSDGAWVKRSTHESYAKTYAVGLLAAGCVFQSRHGMERPGWFEPDAKPGAPRAYDYYGAYDDEGSAWRLDWVGGGPEADGRVPSRADDAYRDAVDGELTFGWGASFPRVAAECRAAREGAALFDQSYFGKFLLEGPRARAKFMAGDPDKAAGDVTYTVLCDANGGVEADLTMTKLSDTAFYVVSGGATQTKDLAWIEARRPSTSASTTLSADKGYRHWHADLSNAETPFEAGIGFTVARRLKSDGDFRASRARGRSGAAPSPASASSA